MVLSWPRKRFSDGRVALSELRRSPAASQEPTDGRFQQPLASHIFSPVPKLLPAPSWKRLACGRREPRRFGLSLVPSAMGISALKTSWSPTFFWLVYVKFPALGNGRHNTSRCVRLRNPMRFHLLTRRFCAR